MLLRPMAGSFIRTKALRLTNGKRATLDKISA